MPIAAISIVPIAVTVVKVRVLYLARLDLIETAAPLGLALLWADLNDDGHRLLHCLLGLLLLLLLLLLDCLAKRLVKRFGHLLGLVLLDLAQLVLQLLHFQLKLIDLVHDGTLVIDVVGRAWDRARVDPRDVFRAYRNVLTRLIHRLLRWQFVQGRCHADLRLLIRLGLRLWLWLWLRLLLGLWLWLRL